MFIVCMLLLRSEGGNGSKGEVRKAASWSSNGVHAHIPSLNL